MEQPKRSRPLAKHWCMTINNPTPASEGYFADERFQYAVFGREKGANGTPHLQGYVCFKTRATLTGLRKIFIGGHFEVMRGTPKQAADYCKKGEQTHEEWSKLGTKGPNYGKNADYVEYGDVPLAQTEAANFKNQEIYDEALQLAKENKLDEKIAADSQAIPPNLSWEHGSPPNEWHYGASGTGKSKYCRSNYPNAYIKMFNKWWENYEGQEVVLIEDIGHLQAYLGDHLKIWADRYGFRAEVKGTSNVMRPQKIIVTSNYHPNELWSDPNIRDPILRRFKLIHYPDSVNDVLMPKSIYSPESPQYSPYYDPKTPDLYETCPACKYQQDACNCPRYLK